MFLLHTRVIQNIQYSNKHHYHHPVPPTVLHSNNTVGTRSVHVCVRLRIQLTALKAHQILSLFATALKFSIKIYTTNSHKINFTMSIFNQFFLAEFSLQFLQVSTLNKIFCRLHYILFVNLKGRYSCIK